MTELNEHWLPVVGWAGWYEVSDLGRVRSVDRTIVGSDGRIRHWRGILLKQHVGLGTHGYPTVGLTRNCNQKSRLVHQLVMEAFVGPCPPGQEVRHGPGGKLDARLVNLCYGTRAENIHDRTRDGQDNSGELNGSAKLTREDVEEIRARASRGENQRDLAKHFGVCFQNINLIVLGKTWTNPP